jgi:hypothetical protein|tara:strand:+ start:371 stop:703 length:333 start_codon:yes stop_codon:yes gene_type:complete
MRLDEFYTDEKVLPFDVVEDTLVYMRNDPMFYRREYFPAVSKLADCQRSGKDADPKKLLASMVEKGCDEYCRKFNLARSSEDIYTAEDRNNLLQKIHSEETENIKEGDYT